MKEKVKPNYRKVIFRRSELLRPYGFTYGATIFRDATMSTNRIFSTTYRYIVFDNIIAN